jgi:putative transposase
MARNFLRLYAHLVWKTWDQLPLVTPDVRAVVYPVLLRKAGELGCSALAVGGVEDHVHLLVSFPATVAVSTILKELKGASSHAAQSAGPDRFFKWQGSYGAVSVSPSGLRHVIEYIENQEAHHRRGKLDGDLEAVTELDD